MSEWEVYCWMMLENVQFSLCTIFISSIVWMVAVSIICTGEFEKLKPPLITFVVILALNCVIPNSKQYAVIKVLPAVVNSDFAKEATGDSKMIYDMARDYLKNMLKVEAPDAKG